FFLLMIAYMIGPNVPAETPEIPIHIKSPKKGGGFKTSNEARTPTTMTATRLIFNAILSTFSSSTLIMPRFTNTFLNISLAKTVDITTNKPSVVIMLLLRSQLQQTLLIEQVIPKLHILI